MQATQLKLEFPQEPKWVQLEIPFPVEQHPNPALLYVVARKIASYEKIVEELKNSSGPIDQIKQCEGIIHVLKERISQMELEHLKAQNKNDASYLKSNV